MASSTDSKTKRSKLPPRREPYWSRLQKGLHLGYRAADEGEGTWIARWRDEEGKRHFNALGAYDDTPDRGAYDQAKIEAEKWADQCEHGAIPKGETVADACALYVENRRAEEGDRNANDAEVRFKRLVYGKAIGRKVLSKLRSTDVERWRNDQIPKSDDDEDVRRAKDTANRTLSALKAALNYAFANKLIGNDSAWRTVKSFKDVARRRERFLTAEQRAKLLEKCPDDLRALCTAVLLTACRPGELVAATVADFDKKNGVLTLRKSKTGFRQVTLSTAAMAFFTEHTKDRIANAPILEQSNGLPWNRFAWRDLFKPAVRAARLPRDVVLYLLRHAAISEMITGGVNTSVVAKLAGTSTTMIDKHYGHLIHDGVRDRLDMVKMI